MINTGSYKNFNPMFKSVSISWDKGKAAGYQGSCYSALAPKKEFWDKWKENIGKISEEENNKYYIEEYYKQVLSKLDVEKVYGDIIHTTLLCYEEPEQFCHRHIVAAWFNLLLGDSIQPVTEVTFVDGQIVRISDSAQKYMDVLEEVIKSNENLRGFNSVRAWYLFEQGEEFEARANAIEEKDPDASCNDLRQIACYYRCEADEAEAAYKAAQYKKKGE